jgi:CrcB protein
MQSLIPYVLVFIGGGIGSGLRLGVTRLAFHLTGAGFPLGTLTVNVVGSFVMGALAGLFAMKAVPEPLRVLLMTGILGGFTTFSAFSLDFATLYERGELGLAALYLVASVALSVGALFAGLVLMRHVTA